MAKAAKKGTSPRKPAAKPKARPRPASKSKARPAAAARRPAPAKTAPPKPKPEPVSTPAPATPPRTDTRRHVLSLAFLRDGDEFLARLETDGGEITELKNRALDQLLMLVAGELEDLL
ncbi:MAG: hypothetical protein L3K11_05455 [Thermoplasmata archaeon]|nr:hypothetical protein [Thermoplasmata archaeon]